ncbi:STAS/SEC14 domain-containing protein [Planktothrix sp. FACHB-1355]|uniref:STAS/SEC14 domain-containing protein n=1 Tax=Aerosakkonema funiforme FACHB-1375 TaxID=2949571 RepID=A0A926VCM2_9CYAN|nr:MULTISPECIES: STAS/SEC14 domain-containing protein [Oscillatoriales]MBD2181240.1 STAS/SEC14 domain-containing protein [Aerosakkonema funiforme FACHB-1375]MBD3561935.1 STAS/SEC14 domain-containing protein [Planktothrix sp. FACHB-1355]
MSTVKVEIQLSSEDLLKAVEQLSQPDLEIFVSQVIALQAQRKANKLPQTEAELLLKINQGITSDTQKRYDEFIAKREAETLTPDEYKELLDLTEQIEKLQAERIEYLAELARLRGTSLTAVMENLGIRTLTYV